MDISKIDNNFAERRDISSKQDIHFYNVDSAPFTVYGVFKENGLYRRIPEGVAKKVSEGVYALHTNTAGGRVRFRTNSPYIAIRAEMNCIGKMSHFALAGSGGFDLYADNVYVNTFVPPYDVQSGYDGCIDIGNENMKEITVNFPRYSNVKTLYIGLKDTASAEPPSPYSVDTPIVFYGSSITQGGCASRPGTTYPCIVSRYFNCDYVNLGFSGNAKAEDEIINYIKGLQMSAFVLDYDHNAPNEEHLRATHERMFTQIRDAHPTLPILIMSRPKLYLNDFEKERLEIIRTTYNNAVAKGDKNVYLLTGAQLTSLCGNEGTVDNCHPTDFGFASMAQAVISVLKNIF
ncbi:MAG: hypothetical protein IJW19_03045 [Clostridia bacterium]|nr:hypothetical protein [Clostridia bacterium]